MHLKHRAIKRGELRHLNINLEYIDYLVSIGVLIQENNPLPSYTLNEEYKQNGFTSLSE